MHQRLQYRRLLLLVLLLGAAFAGLGYRLVDLQVVRHDELSRKAASNTERQMRREPRRGDILDARGNLLATSVFVKTVCADPVLIGDRQADVARVLAPLLQMTESELHQRLLPRLRQNAKGETITNRYVVLKHKVPVETWEKIRAAMSGLSFDANPPACVAGALPESGSGGGRQPIPTHDGTDTPAQRRPGGASVPASRAQQAFFRNLRAKGIFADSVDDQQRVYPNQQLAAHVLGFVGMADPAVGRVPSPGVPLQAGQVGKEGIELALNEKLSGVRGWRVTEKDRRGRELVALRDQDVAPRDGLNVVLTIDSVVQHIVETALAEAMAQHTPISISGIVVRPRTGEILALATLPSFDPNQPGAAPPEARRNRVITDVIEPGSTFKVVVVSAALNDRAVSLADAFDCEHGHFAYGGRVLHDHEAYGVLSVQDIIAKSSNIGAAKIGLRLGANRLYDYVQAFGFGTRTGVPLPGEAGGIVHPPKSWSKVSIVQIPMGHGLAVTRLQMVMAMCAIANGGALMQPMLVDRLEDREGNTVVKYRPQRVRQVIGEGAARGTVAALKAAVSPAGTAPKAALEHFTVAGKTGTAQKVGQVSPTSRGYMPGKYVSSFVGFFPADDAELCISIVLDEPKQGFYGGQIASPVFRQIAVRAANYLGIRPDLEDTGNVGTFARIPTPLGNNSQNP